MSRSAAARRPGPTRTGQGLAFTGARDAILVLSGLALVGGGGSLVALTYRRRSWVTAPPNRRPVRVRASAMSTRSRRGRR